MSEHRWLDQVPAFVLESLEPGEMEAFAEHLDGCDRCLDAVRGYREGLALLAGEAPRAVPAPDLRARVLASAASRRRPSGPTRSSGAPKYRGRASPIAWLAAAAMLAGALWVAWSASRAASARDTALAELADARARVRELESGVSLRDSMLAMLAGPDVRTSTLAATGVDPQLRLFVRGSGAAVLVTAFGLPPAPGGRTYQLWGIRGSDTPVSIGTFDTGPTGSAVALLTAEDGGFEIGAVTEEPAGGSPQPTSQPFLLGAWPGASTGP